MVSMGMVLEQYSNDVIAYITDPRTGVQRRKNWPPTIAEIVRACDDRVAQLHRTERFKNWGKGDDLLLNAPKTERPTSEDLIAKYGPNFGLNQNFEENRSAKPFQAPTTEAIDAHYKEHKRLGVPLQQRNKSEAADDE
jgi:hypothetical protein